MAFFQLTGGGLRGLALAREKSRALDLAQSHLAEIGITTPLVIGTAEGRYDDRIGWRLEIAPVDVEPSREKGRARPYWVTLEALNMASEKLVQLKTVKFSVEGAP